MVEFSVALMLFHAVAALVLPFTLGPKLGLVRNSVPNEFNKTKQHAADTRLTGHMVRSDE